MNESTKPCDVSSKICSKHGSYFCSFLNSSNLFYFLNSTSNHSMFDNVSGFEITASTMVLKVLWMSLPITLLLQFPSKKWTYCEISGTITEKCNWLYSFSYTSSLLYRANVTHDHPVIPGNFVSYTQFQNEIASKPKLGELSHNTLHRRVDMIQGNTGVRKSHKLYTPAFCFVEQPPLGGKLESSHWGRK